MLKLKAALAALALISISGCLAGSTTGAQLQSTFSAAVSGTNVQLAWTANPGEQVGFKIEQSTDGVTFTPAATILDGTYQATIGGFTSGELVYFRIYGYNTAGNSPYSPVVQVQL